MDSSCGQVNSPLFYVLFVVTNQSELPSVSTNSSSFSTSGYHRNRVKAFNLVVGWEIKQKVEQAKF